MRRAFLFSLLIASAMTQADAQTPASAAAKLTYPDTERDGIVDTQFGIAVSDLVETALVGHLMPTADPAGPHWPRWQAAMGQGFGYAPEDFRRWGAAS